MSTNHQHAPLANQVATSLTASRDEFLGFLERRVGNRALAEDILQEAFSRGLERLDTLRSDESAVAWFYRMLRNAVVDHHRRETSAARALDLFSAEAEHTELPPSEVARTTCQCVTRVARTLKPEYTEALRRIEVDGVAVKDFAAEAGISSSNAAVRVFRAREALRKQVVASCGSCAEDGCVNCDCAQPRGGRLD